MDFPPEMPTGIEALTIDSKTIGDYSIGHTIGTGTFGKVKLGIHMPTKEPVAIKILDKEKIRDKDESDCIVREMNLLKSLDHPNIIKVYDILENSKYYFIVMEYASGGELFHYISKKKRLSDNECSFFFFQIVNGIEFIHKNNIAHRDLKPENLLLADNKIIKIIDFGLSNFLTEGIELSTPCGSPSYSAPEMIQGNKYSGVKIDVWSAGIVLYVMACGFLPFEGTSNQELFKKIITCQLQFPHFVPFILRDLIMKILVLNPKDRVGVNEIKAHSLYKHGKIAFLKDNKIFDETCKIIPKVEQYAREITCKQVARKLIENNLGKPAHDYSGLPLYEILFRKNLRTTDWIKFLSPYFIEDNALSNSITQNDQKPTTEKVETFAKIFNSQRGILPERRFRNIDKVNHSFSPITKGNISFRRAGLSNNKTRLEHEITNSSMQSEDSRIVNGKKKAKESLKQKMNNHAMYSNKEISLYNTEKKKSPISHISLIANTDRPEKNSSKFWAPIASKEEESGQIIRNRINNKCVDKTIFHRKPKSPLTVYINADSKYNKHMNKKAVPGKHFVSPCNLSSTNSSMLESFGGNSLNNTNTTKVKINWKTNSLGNCEIKDKTSLAKITIRQGDKMKNLIQQPFPHRQEQKTKKTRTRPSTLGSAVKYQLAPSSVGKNLNRLIFEKYYETRDKYTANSKVNTGINKKKYKGLFNYTKLVANSNHAVGGINISHTKPKVLSSSHRELKPGVNIIEKNIILSTRIVAMTPPVKTNQYQSQVAKLFGNVKNSNKLKNGHDFLNNNFRNLKSVNKNNI